MSRASLAAFRRTTEALWPRHRQEGAKAHLLKVAREGHAAIMQEQSARAGVPPSFEAYANTPGNANLESVILPGPIVYKYGYRAEIVKVALEALRDASPIRSGAYRRGHMLFVNGIAMDGLPANVPSDAEIMISNPVPYARRIEVGMTKSGRPFVMQVEPRIYERVTRTILWPRYGQIAAITFNYASLPGAWRIKGGLSAYYGTGTVRKQTQRHYFGTVSSSFAKQWGTTGHARVTFRAGEQKVRKRRQRAGELLRAPAIFIDPLT